MRKLFTTFTLLLLTVIAMAEGAGSNCCIKYTTAGAGKDNSYHQASYDLTTPLTVGRSYTITMSVKATEAVNMLIRPTVKENENSQSSRAIKITTDWDTYKWTFTAKHAANRLIFAFGLLNGSIYFDDLKLVDDEVGVNMFTNGDFAESSSKNWGTPTKANGTTYSIVDGEGKPMDDPDSPFIPDTWEYAEQGNPNFHVYLCFGQSNMEGNAQPEAQDKVNVPERFKMMAAVNFSNPKRTMGEWYTAVPPLCRQGTGLTPADYFGRTLIENLPEEISVGVINVAVGGARIELFMDEYKDAYIAGEADWFKNYCAQYNNDPLGRLIEMGKKAQQTGVIKGILLHQGESNNGQADWAKKVAEVYKRICYELRLNPAEVPLLAGETLYENMGGGCSWHNTAAMPNLKKEIPNSYVISAKDIPGNGVDAWHFSAAGYRELGRRYAATMLDIIATGIATPAATTNSSSAAYNLNGQKVDMGSMPQGTVYIMNGKKVIK